MQVVQRRAELVVYKVGAKGAIVHSAFGGRQATGRNDGGVSRKVPTTVYIVINSACTNQLPNANFWLCTFGTLESVYIVEL